ncbi:alkaline protease [Streptomyces sp. RKND-216]|uniref:SSI family serine proteinase inhibitor n=1 Tax=Streptomyces sp. RKND-216 TaxID=2562581 RepID=UPI00109DAC9A|nr:SSI family serine proteinase inhibitor [Streptomyces sp. RKND-216]THA25325.1 alkaline protease [Streptomyces sp. RKND-216]
MRHLVKSAAAIPLLAAGALVGLLSGTATAAPTAPDALHAPSALVLTVGDGASAATAVPLRAVTLTCGPQAAGSHPAAAAACGELSAADGNFASIGTGGSDRFCPMVYDPVVVTATGVYDGRRVDFERTYGNPCEMGASGTAVFAF